MSFNPATRTELGYTSGRPSAGPLGPVTDAVKHQVTQLNDSGKYYCTAEMSTELRHLRHGAEHINFDHDLLASSNEWNRMNKPQRRREEVQDCANVMNFTGGTINNIRGAMTCRDTNKRMDNELRQLHHTAMGDLVQAERVMGPNVNTSIDRIKAYCDHIGVTDRYTGYKNNLSRGQKDPVQLGYKWLDTDRRYAGFLAPRSAPPEPPIWSEHDPRKIAAQEPEQLLPHPPTALPHNYMRKPVCQKEKGIAERCGINTTFPGISEYQTRYKRPPRDPVALPFTINPRPETETFGRPHTCLSWVPNCSEYQWRYSWPDGTKIPPRPWVKHW